MFYIHDTFPLKLLIILTKDDLNLFLFESSLMWSVIFFVILFSIYIDFTADMIEVGIGPKGLTPTTELKINSNQK